MQHIAESSAGLICVGPEEISASRTSELEERIVSAIGTAVSDARMALEVCP